MKKSSKKAKDKRPSWDEYFIQMADLVGSRGTCARGHAGAVITKNKRILATGYAGSPVGTMHCDEIGHEMHTVITEEGTTSRHCIRTSHAELNAIINAARTGVALEGGTLYCKFFPCYTCAKSIVNAGIVKIVSLRDYHASARSKTLFKEAKVKYEILEKETEQYKDQ